MNDSLGHCEARLDECLPGVPVKLSLALSTQGTLELVVTFTPIGMAPSAATLMAAKGDAAFGKRTGAFGSRKSLLPPMALPTGGPHSPLSRCV